MESLTLSVMTFLYELQDVLNNNKSIPTIYRSLFSKVVEIIDAAQAKLDNHDATVSQYEADLTKHKLINVKLASLVTVAWKHYIEEWTGSIYNKWGIEIHKDDVASVVQRILLDDLSDARRYFIDHATNVDGRSYTVRDWLVSEVNIRMGK